MEVDGRMLSQTQAMAVYAAKLAGLQPEDPNAPLQWRGLAGAIDVDALDALPAIEWRVRRPGLDSLWHRLFGRPPETPS